MVVLQRDDWPIDHSCDFGHDSLHPHLEQRELLHLPIDQDLSGVRGTKVRLMEHVGIYITLVAELGGL